MPRSPRPPWATTREPNMEIMTGFGRGGLAILEFRADSRALGHKELTKVELLEFVAVLKGMADQMDGTEISPNKHH